jgi:hypothetical protein
VNARFLTATLFLSLVASDASAITIVCSEQDFLRIGLKATMRIEVPAGGPDALKEAFRGYASSHNLRFASTWGADRQPFPQDYPPSIYVETQAHGVGIITRIASGNATADINVETTCYADEEWEPHWRELQGFITASNYRVLDSREIWKFHVQEILKGLSPSPLTRVNTE